MRAEIKTGGAMAKNCGELALSLLSENPTRSLIMSLAESYKLRSTNDKKAFKELWTLWKRSNDWRDENENRIHKARNDAFQSLKAIVHGATGSQTGSRLVKRLPAEGKYVVFSDHHMLFHGSRQNLFRTSGNAELYQQILRYYAAREFTLVENGDVEELVIYEPTVGEAKARAKCSWRELQQRRNERHADQLRRIMKDNGKVYRAVREGFQIHGRLVRLAGNHDLHMQRQSMLKILRRELPKVRVYDYLVLETKYRGQKQPKYLVTHGHQFDLATNPVYAAKLGETISEALSWAFEGPDRFWRWDDDVAAWTRKSGFRNRLVSAKPEKLQITENLWRYLLEDVFKYNVAWEYFESNTAIDALCKEVVTGNEWFKFRHLDEFQLQNELSKIFKSVSGTPALILGHTHEVRHHALDKKNKKYSRYLNCGSVGRFENLLWGIEIVNGTARIIGWRRKDGPRKGAYERIEYDPDGDLLKPTNRRVSFNKTDEFEDVTR